MHFKNIEKYGAIGNLKTCALVADDGSIDWMCLPNLEDASVFAALLDPENGGHFQVCSALGKCHYSQSYEQNTNILCSTFSGAVGTFTVTDFMNITGCIVAPLGPFLIRKIECTHGRPRMNVTFEPRFDYGRTMPEITREGEFYRVRGNGLAIWLNADFPLEPAETGLYADIQLRGGETRWLVMQWDERKPVSPAVCEEALRNVRAYWRGWAEKGRTLLTGDWRTLALRSGLALKLLVNADNGGFAASATTSIPEDIGNIRNWDYRYAWIRDSSLTMQAFYHLGHKEELDEYKHWMMSVLRQVENPADLKPVYSLQGTPELSEYDIPWLAGYENSKPVRVGNLAEKQTQLDTYGELINTFYEATRYGHDIQDQDWQTLRRFIDYVCHAWKQKDNGIWEIRGEPRHYLHSKLLCWVAIDRGIRIAHARGDEVSNLWHSAREQVRAVILEKGFDEKRKTFIQAFDLDNIDATALLIPEFGFLPYDDPRVLGTLEAVTNTLGAGGGLLYRYNGSDNLPAPENAFVVCSFWLVRLIARLGRVEEAEQILQHVVSFAGHLALLSEEIDPREKRMLGNFPEAFSHIGLVNALLYLNLAKGYTYEGPYLSGNQAHAQPASVP